jgi:hypothetical protein
LYGLRNFEAQYWNGAAWQTIPGTAVTSNNLVWRHFAFTPITTSRVRVLVNDGLGGYSRITEIEAWGTSSAPGNTPPTVTLTAPVDGSSFEAPASFTVSASANDPDGTISSVTFYANASPIGSDTVSPYSVDWTNVPAGSYTLTAVALDDDGATTTSAGATVTVNTAGGGGLVNVAAAAAGAVASATSSFSAAYAPAGANDGDRRGVNWGAGGGWNDGTGDTYPDSLQIDFSGSKTISEVDVFTVQDAVFAPADPTAAMTFTQYGIRDFEVQYWNGSTWQTIPGTVVTSNTLVWRRFTFSPITTQRIRVVVSNALATYSRIVEVEAY